MGWERLELILDNVEDTAVLDRQIGQHAKSRHPWRLGIANRLVVGTVPELDFERFGREPLQGAVACGGERFGLPEHGARQFDGRLHIVMLPTRWLTDKTDR